MAKERIHSFDFMRSITAWIIVIYHFAGICNNDPSFTHFPFFYTHANGVWGENTTVSIFFMLSGASLFYNHPDLKGKDLKKYYFSRFKGIFPMFYMLWLFLYYQKAFIIKKDVFYNGSPKSMLLTLFGMDGYLNYRFNPNYYIIGEWFLGGLILLYLFYPLLTVLIKKIPILTTVFLGGCVLALHFPAVHSRFMIQRERNLLVCMFAFWLGMMFIKYHDILKHWIFSVVGGIVALFLLCVTIPVESYLVTQVIFIGAFFGLYGLGNQVMKIRGVNTFFQYTGRISYAIFLLQHVVMSQVLNAFAAKHPTLPQEMLLLVLTFVLIYIFATLATYLNKQLTNTSWFQKLQRRFAA